MPESCVQGSATPAKTAKGSGPAKATSGEPVGLVRPVADGAGDLDGAEHAAVPHVAPALLNPLPLLVHAGAVLPRQLHRLPVSALLPRDHRLVAGGGHKCEASFLLFWFPTSAGYQGQILIR